MTLTIAVRTQQGLASLILGMIVDGVEDRIAVLQEQLANETNPRKQAMLQRRIDMQELILARLVALVDRLTAPVAVGLKTIVVEEPVPSDTTPPVFGFFWPTPPNGYTWINNALGSVGAEVSDSESGVASVLLFVDGAANPIVMGYDGVAAEYFPALGNEWAEGLHLVTLVATDNAGNSASFDFGFYVDLTPPVIASVLPVSTSVKTPQIVAEINESLSGLYDHTAYITVDSARMAAVASGTTVSIQVVVPLSVGDHYVTVEVWDRAGNPAIAYHVMKIVP
jgi:hypothetical protein